MAYGFGPDPMNISQFGVLAPTTAQMSVPDFSGVGPLGDPSGVTGQIGSMVPGSAPSIANGGFLKGFGMDEAKLAMGGLQTIGQLWGAIQSAKLAKKQFNFTKDITETNLANQIRAYNTQLEDRSRSRAVVEGQTADQAQAYIDRNRAVRR